MFLGGPKTVGLQKRVYSAFSSIFNGAETNSSVAVEPPQTTPEGPTEPTIEKKEGGARNEKGEFGARG